MVNSEKLCFVRVPEFLSHFSDIFKTQKSQLQIPNDRELCVDVQLDREYFVGVVQPVPVNVYDYYEPGQSCHFLS